MALAERQEESGDETVDTLDNRGFIEYARLLFSNHEGGIVMTIGKELAIHLLLLPAAISCVAKLNIPVVSSVPPMLLEPLISMTAVHIRKAPSIEAQQVWLGGTIMVLGAALTYHFAFPAAPPGPEKSSAL